MKPSRVEYTVGETVHGQPVRLVRENGSWSIYKDPLNQRDQADVIRGLPESVLRAIRDAATLGRQW